MVVVRKHKHTYGGGGFERWQQGKQPPGLNPPPPFLSVRFSDPKQVFSSNQKCHIDRTLLRSLSRRCSLPRLNKMVAAGGLTAVQGWEDSGVAAISKGSREVCGCLFCSTRKKGKGRVWGYSRRSFRVSPNS